MLLFFWTSVSYAIGCVNAAYYLLRLRSGADIRVLGSGNAGARNAGRLLGRPTFFLVLLFDAARGALAVWGAYRLGLGDGGAVAAALATTSGHVWPVQLGFRGGKGISVAAGALLVLDGWLVLGAGAVFGLVFGWRRRVTPSGLVAIATIPAWAFLFGRPPAIVGGLVLMVAVVLYAHRRDLQDFFHQRGTRYPNHTAP